MTSSVQQSLAKIRHELRTPINHIIGFSEILLEETPGQVPQSFLDDLQKIRSGGDRLLALIHQHLSEENFPVEKPDIHQLCHELRTPVGHIIGYSELLIEQCHDLGLTGFQGDLGKINSAAKIWLALMERQLIGEPLRAGVVPKRKDDWHTETFTRLEKSLAAAAPQDNALPGIQNGRVLLADDDESNRELLRRRLEKAGCVVTAVKDGVEALDRVRQAEFDVLLLDMLMPGLDGREVLTRIKADPALRHLPVIMISALDQADEIVRCIELGAEDYVAKPFNPVFLKARVGAVIEKKRFRDREASYLRQIQDEKQRSEDLLHVILPRDVAEELKATNGVQPRRLDNVGVLFCDIVGFTSFCDRHPPEEVLPLLQGVVEAFEDLAAANGLEKIKTIGDSFMAAIGLQAPVTNPALNCVRCGLKMIAAAEKLPPFWKVRVGVHVGPVIAGVVGHRKYQFDVWGDTVNTAARLEEAAEHGGVCVSATTWPMLATHYSSLPLGKIELHGKGGMELFSIKPTP